uniref:Uncharacterized protein n=1 Tax=Acrobeloides nanus TaxID=290746 RepID=A0A914CMC0_9BILA
MSGLTILAASALTFLAFCSLPVNAADELTKSGSKLCLGKICDDSNILWYYECCGDIFNDCCIRIQLWVWIVLVVVGLLIVAGAVLGFLRRRC